MLHRLWVGILMAIRCCWMNHMTGFRRNGTRRFTSQLGTLVEVWRRGTVLVDVPRRIAFLALGTNDDLSQDIIRSLSNSLPFWVDERRTPPWGSAGPHEFTNRHLLRSWFIILKHTYWQFSFKTDSHKSRFLLKIIYRTEETELEPTDVNHILWFNHPVSISGLSCKW